MTGCDRAFSPGEFVGSACIATGSTEASAIDDDIIGPGMRFYLVRAINDCPAGSGPLGYSSSGHPTPGRSCP